jgi:hypothetical protein
MTPDERAVAILAVSALVGGGVLSYEASRSIQEGDLLKVDEPEKKDMTIAEGAMTGAAALVGVYLTYESLKDTAKEVGVQPLVLGSLGLTGIVGFVWWRNR